MVDSRGGSEQSEVWKSEEPEIGTGSEVGTRKSESLISLSR